MSKWFVVWGVLMPNVARSDTWDNVMAVMVLTMLICVAAVIETTVNS